MRLTYSNVTSTIALVAALGTGSAYAAVELAKDSVGARELKRSAVRSSEIRNGSVGVADLSPAARRAGTLTKARAAQVVEEVITDPALGLTIKVQGEKGDKGDAIQGPAGPAGAPGIAAVVVREATVPVAGQSTATADVRCEVGERAIGGGGRLDRDGGILSRSIPLDGAAGWAATVANQSSEPSSVRAFALCARIG